MLKFKRTSRVRPEISFTPLIDCAFTLIIFFAVSTTLISARTGMKLNVPEKTSVEKMPDQIQISIRQAGPGYELRFKDLVVPDAWTIGMMVKKQLEEDPTSQFIIAAEPGVVYDQVIRIIDIVNESGGKQLALQLNKRADGKETKEPK